MEVEVPTKPWYQSTIILVNILSILLAVIGVIADDALKLGIPPQVLVWIVLVGNIITIILRVIRENPPIGPAGGTRTVAVGPPVGEP